jgi:hypothetical protein
MGVASIRSPKNEERRIHRAGRTAELPLVGESHNLDPVWFAKSAKYSASIGPSFPDRRAASKVAYQPLSTIAGTIQRRLLFAQRWGNRPAFLWIAKDLRCCASG